MLRALLCSSLLIVACSGKKQEAAPAAAGSGSAGSSAAPAPAPAKPAAAKPKAPEKVFDRAAYHAGMAKGRKATDAKQYAEAIKGFDAALAAKPGDPRALAERGYARFLEGSDLAAAAKDLDHAWSGTKDPKLLSMIWFNRGLVEEKLGNVPNALAAFVVANGLRPTKAAQDKIAGKGTCPVTEDHELTVWEYKPVEAADWFALAAALPHVVDTKYAAKEDVWEALTEVRTEPKLPEVIKVDDGAVYVAFLVVKAGARLRAVPIGAGQGGRCPGYVGFDVAEVDATRILVSGGDEWDSGYTFMCDDKDGDRVECTGKPGEVDSGVSCAGGTEVMRSAVFDLTGKLLLVVEQPKADKAADVKLDPAGLKISGLGCDRVDPLK